MFCRNCGTELKEGAKFCPKCGTPATPVQQKRESQFSNGGQSQNGELTGGTQAVSRRKAKKIPVFAIGVIVILIAAVVLIVRGFLGGGYEEPIKNLVRGIEKRDGSMILKAFPEELLEAAEEEDGYDREEMAQMFESVFSYSIGDFDLTDIDYTVSYEIKDDLDLSEREMKEIEDDLEAEGADLDIKAGKEVELELKIAIDGIGYEETREETIEVIKIGGKWYINPLSM